MNWILKLNKLNKEYLQDKLISEKEILEDCIANARENCADLEDWKDQLDIVRGILALFEAGETDENN